jgi:hypothetical protein
MLNNQWQLCKGLPAMLLRSAQQAMVLPDAKVASESGVYFRKIIVYSGAQTW